MITEVKKEYDIPFKELDITAEKIIKFLNIQDGMLSEFARETLNEILKAASKKASVKGGFVIFQKERIIFHKNNFLIDHVIFNSENIITPKLRNSESVALFAATAGEYFEEESRKFISDGDVFMGYLIDSAGSEIAENAAEWIDRKIGEFANAIGLKTTSRYSPGYCGWKVGEQHKLFSFLPQNFCGIRLTSSALMIPIKSVSGIIGIGSGVNKEEYQCAICEDVNCFRRKI